MFRISVIVTTSPGREENLAACLQLLAHQYQLPLEVIVVDDGSDGGEQLASATQWPFELHYLWRPNDARPARSRNLGAQQAQGDLLVFIDSDILLNPRALEAYAFFIDMKSNWLLYGYFGYRGAQTVPSTLYPGRQVQWRDHRYIDYTPTALIPAPNMLRYPHEWAWSGNFALHRRLFQVIGGFDARHRGWGGEDLDFASRAVQRGFEVHFLIDAWGEHQPHAQDELFHTLPEHEKEHVYVSHYTPASYPVRVLSSPQGLQDLLTRVQQHYLRKD